MATQPPPKPIDHNQDWTTPDAIKALKRQLGAFCARAAKIAKDTVPPGTNAASGFFREGMMTDPELIALTHPNVSATDADSAAIYQLVTSFEQGVKGAFQPENHSSNAFTNTDLFLKALQTFGADVVNIVKDIAAIWGGNVDLTKIKADVDTLIKKIEANGAKYDGTHANGWIASNLKGAAKTVQDSAKAVSGIVKDADAKKVADFVSTVCQKLEEIPEFANNPWLYAEWQVQFGAIMDTAAQSLAA